MTRPKSLRGVAHHEAGHAVAQAALLDRCDEAFIRDDGTGGCYLLTSGDPAVVAVLYIAGPVAHAIATRKALSKILEIGGADDLANVVALGADPDRAIASARRLLRGRWRTVARIARALLAIRHLTGADVRAIVSASNEPTRLERAFRLPGGVA